MRTSRRAKRGLALLAAALLSAASLSAEGQPWSTEGLASWYGAEFAGRKTSSGETFDPSGWTAAHKSLPLGTLVLVTNPANGRRCVVKVNDRGPFVEGRVMDLSEAAASYLGYLATGTARLSFLEVRDLALGPFGAAAVAAGRPALGTGPEPLPVGRAAPAAGMAQAPAKASSCEIQVASYRNADNARRAAEVLRRSGYSPDVVSEAGYFRVYLHALPAASAEAVRASLGELGFPGVIVRIETPLD